MAPASNFPNTIDTDVELYRVGPPDAVIPAHHNNHTDALQAIEASIGVIGGSTFRTGLAHFSHFPSVAMPNPRYPWADMDPGSWMCADGATPETWTIENGLTVDYDKPIGYGLLTFPEAATTLVASVDVPEGDEWHAVLRFAFVPWPDWCSDLAFGFSEEGDGSDLDGMSLDGYSWPTVQCMRYLNGSGEAPTERDLYGWINLWFHHDGSNLRVYYSPDGVIWQVQFVTGATTRAPTKFCMRTFSGGVPNNVWLDYIQLGSAPPDGQAVPGGA